MARGNKSVTVTLTAAQAEALRQLANVGIGECQDRGNDYANKGHLSYYGSLTAQLKKHGLTVEQLLPKDWDPRKIWAKSA